MRRIGVSEGGLVPDFANLGISAAIIDTGIDKRHPDLNIVGGKSFCTSEINSDPYKDGLGHGTHVAGILGAKNNGQGIIGAAPGGGGGTKALVKTPSCFRETHAWVHDNPMVLICT
jgi:subtilisin family serine protease